MFCHEPTQESFKFRKKTFCATLLLAPRWLPQLNYSWLLVNFVFPPVAQYLIDYPLLLFLANLIFFLVLPVTSQRIVKCNSYTTLKPGEVVVIQNPEYPDPPSEESDCSYGFIGTTGYMIARVCSTVPRCPNSAIFINEVERCDHVANAQYCNSGTQMLIRSKGLAGSGAYKCSVYLSLWSCDCGRYKEVNSQSNFIMF